MQRPFDTDNIRKTPELRARFTAQLIRTDDGCLLYPDSKVWVELRSYDGIHGISPARLAWALAHSEDHLGIDDFAVHICAFGSNHNHGDLRVCCEPTHLRKGDASDIPVLKQARRVARRSA